jgi:phosphoribosylaminoimidazole-succinocarboxamide synthase
MDQPKFQRPEKLGGVIGTPGKTKTIYNHTKDKKYVFMHFTDNVSAGNAARIGTIPRKGFCCCETSNLIMRYLYEKGYPVSTNLDSGALDYALVEKLEMAGLEIIARNVITGGAVKRFGLPDGILMEPPAVEFNLKNDKHNDPMIPLRLFDLFYRTYDQNLMKKKFPAVPNQDELFYMLDVTEDISSHLFSYLKQKGILLLDLKIEWGQDRYGFWKVGDCISQDEFRARETNGRLFEEAEIGTGQYQQIDLAGMTELDSGPFRRGSSQEESIQTYKRSLDAFRKAFE